MNATDKVLATVRTVAAGLASWLLTWAGVHWHVVLSPHDSDLVKGAVFVLVLAVYHAAASAVQRRWPAWSERWPVLRRLRGLVALLLLSARQPVGYVTPTLRRVPAPPRL